MKMATVEDSAECLIEIFSQVGLPKIIATDRGSPFSG